MLPKLSLFSGPPQMPHPQSTNFAAGAASEAASIQTPLPDRTPIHSICHMRRPGVLRRWCCELQARGKRQKLAVGAAASGTPPSTAACVCGVQQDGLGPAAAGWGPDA
ncbi:hypothetical protein BS78_05G283900 [Paspalum vaginatum]|uniref:Uncharacterized protein n=1 Tax=Paspalum vaginatum TaxID=158149 RepID=A0A9W7XAD9_9POAL|nr:hypothetical protein BS78_K266600 [Paspalum vaginatum]KAJ1277292.1 hypothetical protein BS78_05G283900 [Paspalum vaginatum]